MPELLPAALVSVGDATTLKHVVVLLQDPNHRGHLIRESLGI
jgi:hypothetical protein